MDVEIPKLSVSSERKFANIPVHRIVTVDDEFTAPASVINSVANIERHLSTETKTMKRTLPPQDKLSEDFSNLNKILDFIDSSSLESKGFMETYAANRNFYKGLVLPASKEDSEELSCIKRLSVLKTESKVLSVYIRKTVKKLQKKWLELLEKKMKILASKENRRYVNKALNHRKRVAVACEIVEDKPSEAARTHLNATLVMCKRRKRGTAEVLEAILATAEELEDSSEE